MRTFVILAVLVSSFNFAHYVRNPDASNSMRKSAGDYYAYVSLDSEQCIAVYRIDSVQGELNFVRKISVSGAPGSLTVDPSHRVLYAAVRSTSSISSFRINAQNGDLTHLKTIRAAGNPVYIGTDKTGKFLLTAYFGDNKAAVYRIGRDGVIQDSAVQVLGTEQNPHAIQTDPSNRYVFIPCRTGETILQYKLDLVTGRLTPNIPDRAVTSTNTGPRHFTFHGRLNTAYFINEFASTVTAFRMNPSNGTLLAFQSLSTLPQSSTATNTGADIHLTPDNRFLYASNRGDESIAAFSVDSTAGTLTSIGRFATEKTPRAFAIDPTGKFLIAGGQGSGKIAAYRIDDYNGRLIPISTYDAGKFPVWILIARLKP